MALHEHTDHMNDPARDAEYAWGRIHLKGVQLGAQWHLGYSHLGGCLHIGHRGWGRRSAHTPERIPP